MRNEILLHAGDLTLGVCPDGGGSIARFTWTRDGQTIALMRPANAAALARAEAGDPRDMASFPLVPFSGRINQGRFTFEGREIRLPPNFPPEPHAIHGDGWSTPWQVSERGDSSLDLFLHHDAPDHALRYTARQAFQLDPAGLTVRMAVTNTGDRAMPAGLGMHPYFIKTQEARLITPVTKVWLTDDSMMPTELVDVPDPWNFTSGRTMSEVIIDNGFCRWPARATIEWPEWDTRLVMTADPVAENLVVFCPPGGDFFCVEPVTNTADGFNLAARGVAETGVKTLAPGETLPLSVHFAMGPMADSNGAQLSG